MNNKFKYIGRSKLRQKLHQRCDLKNIKIFEPHQIKYTNEIIRLANNYV